MIYIETKSYNSHIEKYVCDGIEKYGTNDMYVSLINYIIVKRKPTKFETNVLQLILNFKGTLSGITYNSIILKEDI
jgi:hypothetical protein